MFSLLSCINLTFLLHSSKAAHSYSSFLFLLCTPFAWLFSSFLISSLLFSILLCCTQKPILVQVWNACSSCNWSRRASKFDRFFPSIFSYPLTNTLPYFSSSKSDYKHTTLRTYWTPSSPLHTGYLFSAAPHNISILFFYSSLFNPFFFSSPLILIRFFCTSVHNSRGNPPTSIRILPMTPCENIPNLRGR